MKIKEISKHIDYTQLKAFSTWEDIKNLCDEAIENECASVCIPPAFVASVKNEYKSLVKICTVIGFPLGYNTIETKAFETMNALNNGADEIDMVINIGDAKSGNFDKITQEITTLKKIVGNKVLKVIVEACYLTLEEKIALCKCVSDGGANFIKTSTGFGTGGAKLEDIILFKKEISKDVKIKAAGGVRTKVDMEAFLEAGCERIGASTKFSKL